LAMSRWTVIRRTMFDGVSVMVGDLLLSFGCRSAASFRV
jgi:hypothetical protein